MPIELFGMSHPTRSTRVAWALEEVGAEWTYTAVKLDDPEFLVISPLAKVPAVRDGDFVLTESGAICTWLGDRYPQSGLVPPAGSRERALYDRWCLFVLTELEQAPWLKAKHKFALPAHVRATGVDAAAAYEWDRAARVLVDELAGRPFLVGGRFTAADLLASHTIFWGTRAKFEVPPALLAYAANHGSRPALARAMAKEAGR
jgi:glutathione S-transferase